MVTAIAGYDDDVAIRALTALQDLGLRAPDDVAVIGFDDIEHGAITLPRSPPSTLTPKSTRIAARAGTVRIFVSDARAWCYWVRSPWLRAKALSVGGRGPP